MGLSDKPNCRKSGAEEETSVHILCEGEVLASLRHTHLGSFFFDPEDIRVLEWGPYGTLLKEQGSYNLIQNTGHREPFLRPRCISRGEVPYSNCYSVLFYRYYYYYHQF
jgi:hypothetical protein